MLFLIGRRVLLAEVVQPGVFSALVSFTLVFRLLRVLGGFGEDAQARNVVGRFILNYQPKDVFGF